MSKKKFVTFVDYQHKEHIMVFPEKIQHSSFASAISELSFGELKPVSGGFVKDGECFGKSISLNMESRPQDTELLKSAFD